MVWTPDDYYAQGVLQVTIRWPMFTLDDVASDLAALRTVASILYRDKVDWIRFRDEAWILDIEKLKYFCLLLYNDPNVTEFPSLDLLKGQSLVRPEVKWKRCKTPGFEDMYDVLIYLHVFKDWKLIPPSPQFDINSLTRSGWVLECEETGKQGTAFSLSGIGLVTCQHVLGPQTHAFKAYDISRKYPVSVQAEHATIDLAILQIEAVSQGELPLGTADNLEQMDAIAIAGFPNYRLGDTFAIYPGLISGFRPVSGIRRILINAPIVAGCSGGPVLNGESQAIGVAVTGADRMEDAHLTEHHGVIPIDALKLLEGA